MVHNTEDADVNKHLPNVVASWQMQESGPIKLYSHLVNAFASLYIA